MEHILTSWKKVNLAVRRTLRLGHHDVKKVFGER